jgi:hypothetical protein
VRVMNLKDEDLVSAVALVIDAGDDTSEAGEAVLADPTVDPPNGVVAEDAPPTEAP